METTCAVLGSGGVCYLTYFLLGLPIISSGIGGKLMFIAPLATPLLVAPVVALPFARSSERIANLLAEVEKTQHELTREVAERVLVQGQLEELARRDPLTGLLNRRGFFELASVPSQRDLVVMTVDVDNFKDVNDVWGHATGDHVLCVIAAALQDLTGPNAHAARLGGDEFVVLTDATGTADLEIVADRLAGLSVELPDGSRTQFSCSVGVSLLTAGASIDVVLAEADAAMYDMKRSHVRSSDRPPSRFEAVHEETVADAKS